MLKICLVLVSLTALVAGHGMLLDPPNRASMWRFDRSYPPNYADNQNFCGGFGTQHGVNQGKCGVCGDDYRVPHPQPNENTGIYGRGKIVATYQSGSIVEVTSHITANHLGNIQYSICHLTDSDAPESGEECFKPLQYEDGSLKFPIYRYHRIVTSRLVLPKGFKCNHCTLRWTYTAGNNWGVCEDGSGAMGCGNQETFRSCSDVSIV